MQQIADAAGVSRMAVSLALRNSPKISKPTAERIRKLADEFGYRPNPMVSALMTQLRQTREVKRPSVLAYVTAFPTEEGWRKSGPLAAFFEGARQRASALGYTLEEWWVRRPGMTERRFCDILQTRDIHGMIVAPMPPGAAPLQLEWPRFAAATIAYSLASPEISRASNDHFGSINVALRELTALGYRRIGLALIDEGEQRAQSHWVAGMLAYQQQIPLAERVPTFFGSGSIARSFASWYHEHQPYAVLSFGGECLRVFHDQGLRVPQDVGYVNLALTAGESGTAGVNQNFDLVGAAAVDLVDGQLRRNERGVPRHARTLLIPGEWAPGPTVRDMHARPRRTRVKV
ncbi:MAG TPA: LacI family DNA-binding transcriptional regulator [Chthoniobacteraceae bacterium]|nr:LacI family DNA-binding transcriptional regulator [Chthoniobacteraceae bacterium]